MPWGLIYERLCEHHTKSEHTAKKVKSPGQFKSSETPGRIVKSPVQTQVSGLVLCVSKLYKSDPWSIFLCRQFTVFSSCLIFLLHIAN